MATGTIFRGGNVINGFTHRCHTIVAGCAVAYDTGMAECRIEEAASDVTNTTILSGWQVYNRFAGGSYAIVASCAIVVDSGVIKNGTGKGGGAMAIGTILGGGYMRRWFASCH